MPQNATFSGSTKKQQQLNSQRAQKLNQDGWGRMENQQTNQDYGLSYDSTQVRIEGHPQNTTDASHDAWNNWAENLFLQARPKAEDIRIEVPLTVQATPQEAVQILQKEVEYEKKRIEYDQARALEAAQQVIANFEFPASGSMPLNVETMATAEANRIMSGHHELREEQLAAVEEAERIIGEPPIEDKHTRKPQEFKQDGDLARHHPDIDFPYFFGWLGGQVKEAAQPLNQFLGKTILNAKQWAEAKGALIDDLLFEQIFGWGQKKELSKEEKEKQQKQITNKRMFFGALRAGASRLIPADQRRNLRNRINALNKSLKRSNLSYEGDLEVDGQIRESVLIDEERSNSEKSEQQIKNEKKKKMMMAKTAAKKGPGITMTTDKAHNFNNAAKLAG